MVVLVSLSCRCWVLQLHLCHHSPFVSYHGRRHELGTPILWTPMKPFLSHQGANRKVYGHNIQCVVNLQETVTGPQSQLWLPAPKSQAHSLAKSDENRDRQTHKGAVNGPWSTSPGVYSLLAPVFNVLCQLTEREEIIAIRLSFLLWGSRHGKGVDVWQTCNHDAKTHQVSLRVTVPSLSSGTKQSPEGRSGKLGFCLYVAVAQAAGAFPATSVRIPQMQSF